MKVNLGITFKEARDRVCQDTSAQAAVADPEHRHAAACHSSAQAFTLNHAHLPPASTPPSYSKSHPLAPFPTLTQLFARDSTSQPTEEARPAKRPRRHMSFTSYASALSEAEPEPEDSHPSQEDGHTGWITAGQRHHQRAFPERKHHQRPQPTQLLHAQPSPVLPAASRALPSGTSLYGFEPGRML
jgi:hypothetical protein